MCMGWTGGSVTEWLQRKPARVPYPVLVSQAGKLAMERGWAINVGECPAAEPGETRERIATRASLQWPGGRCAASWC